MRKSSLTNIIRGLLCLLCTFIHVLLRIGYLNIGYYSLAPPYDVGDAN